MKLQLEIFSRLRTKFVTGQSDRGQSMVEFVAVLTAIFLIAGLGRGYVTQLKDVIQQKYRSYCFGVAISDPPQGSYQALTVTDDAGHTMMLSEQIGRMSPEGIGLETLSFAPGEQAETSGDILNFMEQAKDL